MPRPQLLLLLLLRRPLALAILLTSALAVQLVLLKSMPYSRGVLERVPPGGAAPTPNFRLGSVGWDVGSYAHDPVLEPLRAYYRATCGPATGLAAAVAISKDFARRCPFGNQQVDFFSPEYTLQSDFDAHLVRGEPAHCVSRSGLLAGTLLAGGQPARVVQILAYETGMGHNVVEVWDDAKGWVLVDPSMMAYLVEGRDDGYSFTGTGSSTRVAPFIHFQDPLFKVEETGIDYSDGKRSLLLGPRIYPEPWLYLRTGPRSEGWPYKGRFAVTGPEHWRYGPVQRLLRAGIVVNAIALGVVVLAFGYRLSARPRRWLAGLVRPRLVHDVSPHADSSPRS